MSTVLGHEDQQVIREATWIEIRRRRPVRARFWGAILSALLPLLIEIAIEIIKRILEQRARRTDGGMIQLPLETISHSRDSNIDMAIAKARDKVARG